LTLRQYVKIVPTLAASVKTVTSSPQRRRPEGILIDPHVSVVQAHHILERIESVLTRSNGFGEPARRLHREVADLQSKLGLPTYMQ
jgi:hypothetical protein